MPALTPAELFFTPRELKPGKAPRRIITAVKSIFGGEFETLVALLLDYIDLCTHAGKEFWILFIGQSSEVALIPLPVVKWAPSRYGTERKRYRSFRCLYLAKRSML